MRITMIGHSTTRIELAGASFVTDPYFGTRGNPAYGRLAPPGLSREDAGRGLCAVLLSHNHWDHVDRPFLRALAPEVPVLCPRRTGWLTRMQGARQVLALSSWESRQLDSITVTAVPAIHSAVCTGYVLQGEGMAIYFAGDTYHGPFMKEIAQRFHPQIALLPVTTYRLPMTMGEGEAVRAVRDLSPRVVIPIHLGLRPRSPLLRTGQTPEGFERRLRQVGLPAQMVVLREGEGRDL
jgi:L-ascorbate metabolism protein UlaG (beta-lactamase superfamily)